jgi:hypothetical protein
LSAAIAHLTPAQLDLQAAPHLRSIRSLAVHIITGRAWWLHWVMREGSAQLAPMADWNDAGQPAWTASEIVDGLNLTWSVIADGLGRWTAPELAETFSTQDAGQSKATRGNGSCGISPSMTSTTEEISFSWDPRLARAGHIDVSREIRRRPILRSAWHLTLPGRHHRGRFAVS